jgi:two-component sensor histidine kinase
MAHEHTAGEAKRAFDALPAHVAVLNPDGIIVDVNAGWRRYAEANGAAHRDAYLGESYLDVVRQAIARGDDLARDVLPGLESVLAGTASRYEKTYPCPAKQRVSWYRMTVTKPADGRGAVVIHDDVTPLVEAEQRQRLLTQELNHRVKNTLAIVQAIAGQTVRDAADMGAVRDAFLGRLAALARVHEILTSATWNHVAIGDIVMMALEPFRAVSGNTIGMSGPPAQLDARAAVSLSLALHELATNATKYGALSRPGGSVEITWSVEPDGPRLVWRERGGPLVSPPARTGYGSRLIASMGRADGGTRMTFAPEGLEAVVALEGPRPAHDA